MVLKEPLLAYFHWLTKTKTGDDGVEATPGEAADLECAAVWSGEHVEERLLALLEGRPSKVAESLRYRG